MVKISFVLNTMMRNGAVLHLSLAKKPTWELNDSTTAIRVSARTARAALKRGAIVGNGDTLFADTLSQTWRYIEPKQRWPE
jgi:pectin methylesterase-like acyl-CoA thioesterase